ncbi:MAG: hypothetical protein ACI8RD_000599 [Bacillariaceae sp.]|jgi:hypothetical protein
MAQMNDQSTNFLPPPSPIQRIIIIHLNLHELCVNDGTSLGENASIEERNEQILHYHRDSRLGITVAGEDDEEWNMTQTPGSTTLAEEAVNFAGLCTALYSLPTSLYIHDDDNHNNDDDEFIPENDDNDRTKSIYFGNSLLVFVPLESTLDIVAVVQVSRLYQNGIKSETGSASPLAIKASIERSHRIFCMLRGGGIIRRLKEKTSIDRIDNTKNNDFNAKEKQKEKQYPYSSMKRLFGLMKNIRRSKHQISKIIASSSDKNVEEISQHINDLEKEVKSFRESLPIQSIRRDLDAHYNEYLSTYNEVCIRNGGAGRALVEMMPIPIAQDSGKHTFQLSPSPIQPQCLESLRLCMRQILHNHSCNTLNEKGSDLLLGITIFHGGFHILDSNFGKIEITNDCASLLMAYMASYRTKMGHAAMSAPNNKTSTSSQRQPGMLKRLALSLGPMVDEPLNRAAVLGEREDTDILSIHDMQQRGRFIPSPPTFMLGASDQICSLFYGDKQTKNIWAPRISLPLYLGKSCNQDKIDTSIDDFLDTNMVVFEFRQFSFLIYINLSSTTTSASSPENISAITLLMMKLEEELSEAVIHAFHDEAASSSNESLHQIKHTTKYTKSESMPPKWSTEPGQDIIFFERSKQKMILLLDPNHPSSRRDVKKRNLAGSKDKGRARRFMGLVPKTKVKTLSQSHPYYHGSTTLEWSAWGLDCRHLLASRLPLDVCLAFDDMIHEVTTRKDAQGSVSLSISDSEVKNEDDASSPCVVELCTCMPYGWIYAFATREKDIYVFFDNTIYVTFADVQSAALRIQERFAVTR